MGSQVVMGSKGAMGSHMAMDPSFDSRSRVSLGAGVQCTLHKEAYPSKDPAGGLSVALQWSWEGGGS